MANHPRSWIISDHATFHVTWQCHNKDWLLKTPWAKQLYYNLLCKFKDRYQVHIYSYCFMSNHPHLTGYCNDRVLFSDFFRIVNSLFARIYNQRVKRRGQVVMDRFKSPCLSSEADLLKVMFYSDLNPKRAAMVKHPKEYEWSSYHYYAYGKKDRLITPAPTYLQLGTSDNERRFRYRLMVEEILKNDWKEKKPYSSKPFIGNPDWVIERIKEIRQKKWIQLTRWKRQFSQKFKTGP